MRSFGIVVETFHPGRNPEKGYRTVEQARDAAWKGLASLPHAQQVLAFQMVVDDLSRVGEPLNPGKVTIFYIWNDPR